MVWYGMVWYGIVNTMETRNTADVSSVSPFSEQMFTLVLHGGQASWDR